MTGFMVSGDMTLTSYASAAYHRRMVEHGVFAKVPGDLWKKVLARMESEGRSLRFIVTQLLEKYVKEGLDAK